MRVFSEYYTSGANGTSLSYADIYGVSGDTKPVDGLITGSKFIEVDTGKVYFFNEDADAGEEWVFQFSFQG